MVINLKEAPIYIALRAEKNPLFYLRKFFKFSAGLLFFLLILAAFTGTVSGSFSADGIKQLAAGAFLALLCWAVFFEVCLFFNDKLRKPPLSCSLEKALAAQADFNAASFFDFSAAKIYQRAIRKARKAKLAKASPSFLLWALLDSGFPEIEFIFNRMEMSVAEVKKVFKKAGFQEGGRIEEAVEKALKAAKQRGGERVCPADFLAGLVSVEPFLRQLMILNDVGEEDIISLTYWYKRALARAEKNKKFWEKENLARKGSIASDLAAGFSPTLDKYSFDWREVVKKSGLREIVGHQREIAEVERALSKEEINNALIIGEPGSGRKSVLRAVAQNSFIGKSGEKLKQKRFLEFNLSLLFADSASLEEAEHLLEKCFQEALSAGNIILVIKNIENFIVPLAKPGSRDISSLLSEYLRFPNFQAVAITTYSGLHNVLEKKPYLLNLFEKVEVQEISQREALVVLEDITPFFEKKYDKYITYKALREITELSARYLSDFPFPQKALRLLDEAVSWLVRQPRKKVLLAEDVKKIISGKTGIPLEAIEEEEKEKLLHLEKLIHRRIINQEEAVSQISAALRRARAEVKTRRGPIGSFLFLGPTGVGKTETAKTLASIYFGSEEKMIRMDMSEFQSVKDVKRIIGASGESGLLTTAVKENPFSLILLDEIEKAHPNILNLFLQMIDEGWLTDGMGRKIKFQNTIIIATSNAGAELIRQDIEKDRKLDIIKNELLDYLFKEKIFRPEFINRFDGVVVFKPLSRQNLMDISVLMLGKIVSGLKDKGINLEITEKLKKRIVELSYSPQFGAREMKRVIQNKIENLLATALLSGDIKRGDRIIIKVVKDNFVIQHTNKL